MPFGKLAGSVPGVGGGGGGSSTAMPDPLRGTLCVDPTASSVIESTALLVPGAVGLKVTVKVQDAATGRMAPQADESLKSDAFAPITWICLKLSVAVPVFVTVMIKGEAEVFSCCDPNCKLAGAIETAGITGVEFPT
jgi:hypothetical protein